MQVTKMCRASPNVVSPLRQHTFEWQDVGPTVRVDLVNNWRLSPAAHLLRRVRRVVLVRLLLSSHCKWREVTLNDTHSVGHLWTRGRPVAEACTYTVHNIYKRQTSISLGGIRIRISTNRAAAVLRLRPRCHWDRLCKVCVNNALKYV